jgi:hypothetical protein
MADKPQLDRSRTFAGVRGDPINRYLQNGKFFDHSGNYVADADKSWAAPVNRPAPTSRFDEAETETLRRAAEVTGETPDVPDQIQSAATENLRALTAEEAAE